MGLPLATLIAALGPKSFGAAPLPRQTGFRRLKRRGQFEVERPRRLRRQMGSRP